MVETICARRIDEGIVAAEELKALKLDDPEVRKAETARVEKMSDAEKRKFGHARRELMAKARPNLLALRNLEARVEYAEGNYGEALEKLDQLDADFGARRNTLNLRGEVFLRMRDWEKARESFAAAMEIDPESPSPHLGMARAALAEKKFEEGAGHAMASVGLLYHQPRAHYLLGMALYRAGDWENAERAFLISASQSPLLAASYRMLSEIARIYKKDGAEAVQYRVFATQALRRRRELGKEKVAEVRAGAGAPRGTEGEAPMPLLLPRAEALEGVPEEEIITVVTGLPRSGTSLMMQMLQAGGVEAFSDGKRVADEANQKGYYEHEKVAGLMKNQDRSWIAEAKGKAIKVVAPLLAGLPVRNAKGERLHYRVLFMERDLEEILQSQATMLEGKGAAAAGADIGKAYRQQVRGARSWLVRLGIPAMEVSYPELVAGDGEVAQEVARFLGRVDCAEAMAGCVQPDLYRSRG